jgi:MerR family transcriptional regulator, mercuric resistance operon regulatory protein
MPMAASGAFPIGALARRTGVNIETIRYYERSGLLPKPARTPAGYRAYGPGDAQRLLFIRRTRDLGFSLDEVRRLLGLADQKSRSCRSVHALAVGHLAEIRAKIVDLRRMEKILAGMVVACAQGTMPACPLLEALARPRQSEPRD